MQHLDSGWRNIDPLPDPRSDPAFNTEAMLRVIDADAIRRLMARYTWALYRVDAQLLRSIYWPGAHEDHGDYVGPIEGFVEWVVPRLRERIRTTIAVHSIDIDWDGPSRARVHSLGQIHIRKAAPDGGWQEVIGASRYHDLFEKREGEWRIARREATLDWARELGDAGSAS